MSNPQNIVWTGEAIRALGARTDVATASAALGISRAYGYELIRADQFPVRVLRIGHRIVVPTAGILAALDIPEADEVAA